MQEGVYDLPREGIIQPAEYRAFLIDRVAEIAIKAWKARKPGLVGWGLGHAVVAQNRRAVYADGHAQMYGRTDLPEFRRIEGYEDHGVEVLFFWDLEQKLLATAVNVACPSQEVEGRSAVNADFWHEVREQLRARHGKELLVLAWTGAAGDQSPHLMLRKQAEERMRDAPWTHAASRAGAADRRGLGRGLSREPSRRCTPIRSSSTRSRSSRSPRGR